VIDLMHDAPVHDPRASAYLLAALAAEIPEGSVCCAVVDPGVGTDRPAVAVEADGRWFVGPGNGLFELIRRRAILCRRHVIRWHPERLSASFHGRDLFAPVAARLAAKGGLPDDWLDDDDGPPPGADWPDDLSEILYADRFGNLMTGLRAGKADRDGVLDIAGHTVRHARTFGEAAPGEPFWYENSCGLVEIALPNGSAAERLGAGPGHAVSAIPPR